MLEQVKAGEAFELKDLVDYEKDQCVKKLMINENGTKVLLIALDHAKLPEHPAPANALFTVLEGEGKLTYLGNTIDVHHGQSVKFDANAAHSVTADHKMKFMVTIFA